MRVLRFEFALAAIENGRRFVDERFEALLRFEQLR